MIKRKAGEESLLAEQPIGSYQDIYRARLKFTGDRVGRLLRGERL